MSSYAAEIDKSQEPTPASSTQLDLSEVYFLVLHWLSNGPCKQAAEVLLQEVTKHGLLSQQYTVLGGSQPSSYQSLLQRHRGVPADGLLQLLQQCLARAQSSEHAGAQGLQSLLAGGPLAALPALAAAPAPQKPPWIQHAATHAALPQLQLLQQTGLTSRRSATSSDRLPLQYVAERFCHHATFRGHGFPVFSLIFDKEGRRVVTGADDAIVKIWSLETGLLLVTCRGHTGEISDLSLSADGSMVASGSVDSDVRVWSMLPDNLGQNTAILRGHTASINLIDFHPTIPSALLSASVDGSIRLWDARDMHFVSLVLLPNDNFGAFGSSLRVGAEAAATAAAAAAGSAGAWRSLTRAVGVTVAAAAAAAVESEASAARAASAPEEPQSGMLCCSWSPDGRFIVAGGQDCCVYIWHWDLQRKQQQLHNATKRRSSSGVAAAQAAGAEGTVAAKASETFQTNDQQQQQQQQQQGSARKRASSGTMAADGGQQQQQQQRLTRSQSHAQAAHQDQDPEPTAQQHLPRLTSKRSQSQAEQSRQHENDAAQMQPQPEPVQQHEDAVQQHSPRSTRKRCQSQAEGLQRQQQQSNPSNSETAQHVGASMGQREKQPLLSSADWPMPSELQKLSGHKNEVIQAEFTGGGTRMATASLDGSVRVWQLVQGIKGKPKLYWQEAMPPLMVVAVEAAAVARARQRREQAQALIINHMGWTADDSKILAAASDSIIRVWCAHTGALLQLLKGHTQQAHVLEMHPHDPRLALSGGYDGVAILWDITSGAILKRFSSSDTIPVARGSWAAPVIQLVDGHFTPNGNAFCVADVAGQFSLYAVGSPTPLLLSAPYDQFFKKDYDPIMHDEAGFAGFMDPAVPCYHLKGQQPLCDNQFMPYPDDFQEAHRAGRVLEFVKSGGAGMSLRGTSTTLPSSLQLWPPTVTAAVWKALEDRAALIARGSSRIVSEATVRDTAERHALEEHSKLLAALLRGMTLQEQEQRAQQITQAAALRQQQQQRATAADAAAAGSASRQNDRRQQQQQREGAGLTDDVEGELEYEQVADLAGSDSDYAAEQVQTGSDTDWEGADDLSEDIDNDSDASGQRQGHRHSERQRNRRQQRRAAEGRSSRPRRRAEQQERGGPVTRRGAANTPQRQQQQRTPNTRQRKRRRSDSDEGSPEPYSDPEQLLDGPGTGLDSDRARRGQRRSSRRAAAAGVAAAAAAAAADEDDDKSGSDADEDHAQEAAATAPADGLEPQQQRKRQRRQFDSQAASQPTVNSRRGRQFECYSWLNQSQHSPNSYVPQLGDFVVYLFEGHKKHLDARNDRLTDRPWEVLKRPGAGQQQWWWQQQQQPDMLQQARDQQQWQGVQQHADGVGNAAATGLATAATAADVAPAAGSTEDVPSGSPLDPAAAAAAAVAANQAAAAAADGQPVDAAAAGLEPAAGTGDACHAAAAAAPYEMRPAEPCTIVGLEYLIQDEQTVPLLTLQLSMPAAAATADRPPTADAAAVAAGASALEHTASVAAAAAAAGAAHSAGVGYLFQVVLPHPSSGHADFVILQSRFLNSVSKTWQVGDRVQNFLLDPEGGSWWVGTVVADQRISQPHSGITADPYGCGGLWERYKVQWDEEDESSEANTADASRATVARDTSPAAAAAAAASSGAAGGGGSSSAGEQRDGNAEDAYAWLSPWELYAAGMSTEAVLIREDSTQMPTEQVARLLHTVERLRHSSRFRTFVTAPPPNAEYSVADGDLVYNRVIALPLGLANIQDRLESGYYRSLQALLHDTSLIATNAAMFNGQDSPLAKRALELYQAIVAAAAEPSAAAAGDGRPQRQRRRSDKAPVEQEDQQHHQQQSGLPDAAAAAAAAATADHTPQQKRSRRTAATRADAFLADCFAADFDASDSEQEAAAAVSDDPEADEHLAAPAAGARYKSSRSRHGRCRRQQQQQQHRKARHRRKHHDDSSSGDVSSDQPSDSAEEGAGPRQRPQRRSSRQQQQQQLQRQQKYRQDYASDFESEEERQQDSGQELALQQRPRRSTRRHQTQHEQDGAAADGMDVQQQQQLLMQGMQSNGGTAAVNQPADAPAAAIDARGGAGKRRIRLKLSKPQQKSGSGAVLVPTAAAAAAAAPPDYGQPAAGAVDMGSSLEQTGQEGGQMNGGTHGFMAGGLAKGWQDAMQAWGGNATDWSAAAAAAQAAWYGQDAEAAAAGAGANSEWQQQQWQQYYADPSGHMQVEGFVQDPQQQQQGWGLGAIDSSQYQDHAAADSAAAAAAARPAEVGDTAEGGSRLRLRMRTKSKY